jgi:excinuclease UvrABC nuclease subunit
MKEAAKNLDFERAASLRDRLKEIRNKIIELGIKESEKKGCRKKRMSHKTD